MPNDIPLLSCDTEDEALIPPGAFSRILHEMRGLEQKPLPAQAVLTFSRKYRDLARSIWGEPAEVRGRALIYELDSDRSLLLQHLNLGASSAAAQLEDLIAQGCRHLITVGSAGSLQADLGPGQVVLVEKGLRDEGTSFHYLEPSREVLSDPVAGERLRTHFEECGMSFRVGATWTTDAPYRETRGKVRAFAQEGILTVDMEASALFAVAQYRKVSLSSVFVVSDMLLPSGWLPYFGDGRLNEGLRSVFGALWDFEQHRGVPVVGEDGTR